jgi:hypothetical protein
VLMLHKTRDLLVRRIPPVGAAAQRLVWKGVL